MDGDRVEESTAVRNGGFDEAGPVLEVSGLTIDVVDGSGNSHELARDVGLSVHRGETVGLVGESGSGKTISSLAIMGLLPRSVRVTAGSVRLEGEELLGAPPKRLRRLRGSKMAMIFQEPMTSLNPAFTIGDQVGEMVRLHRGSSRKEARQRTIEMLDLVGIPEPQRRVHEYPYSFSGGMLQRVMIAMALSCDPSVLIADEPTTAVDVTIQAQLLELLKQMQAEFGMGILLVTHDLGVVADICDRLCVMYAGQVVEHANVHEFFDRPFHPYGEGLLRSMPQSVGLKGRLHIIPGLVPAPNDDVPGCRFHPRCDYRTERCVEERPELRPTSTGGDARCLRATELDLTMPR